MSYNERQRRERQMKINEGMRDAIEAIVNAARTIDEMFDGYPDIIVDIHESDEKLFDDCIERVALSMHHLHRCERLNK